ncbi:MAG TPA: DUF1992 domain-containing protein [Pyrinomonadaceae bacterium]|jgi:hypothetical protein
MSDEVRGIEELIKEAMAKGEFDNLPGKGKPLDLDTYFQAPEELRMGYSMLKSGNFVPEEVQLLKDIDALRSELKSCVAEERRRELSKTLREKSLSYSLLMERAKKSK